ncbi:hypothetical protein QJS10_CPA07g00159 [Acorus calamus]|uniref:Uncharacterized protein n=1 Tax=Acorus calamus TaxID=4465 RepID=A0AAV9EFD9_ACOCL|nr:hypothetical protein QJS10_CPA07g00159 [Acorus calamus]
MAEDEDSPSETNSFHICEEISTNNCLNKKRKLKNEQLGLPSPKHKFGEKSPTTEDSETGESPIKNKIDEQPEGSVKDSNSIVGGYHTLMTLDVGGESQTQTTNTHHHYVNQNLLNWPSTSSINNNAFKDLIYSLESRSVHKPNDNDDDNEDDDDEISECKEISEYADEMMDEPEFPGLEDQIPGFGKYNDYLYPRIMNRVNEISPEIACVEDIYSNGVNSNLHVLSSGRWNLNQAKRLGTRRPTIDQEFEQYFSTLML